jgi:hypothetical protein
LFEFHCLKLLASKGVTDKAKLQVEVVGILWSKLAASGLVVEVDNLLDGIADVVVVLGGVSDLHLALLKRDSISRSTFCGSLALASRWSSISRSCEYLRDVRLVL